MENVMRLQLTAFRAGALALALGGGASLGGCASASQVSVQQEQQIGGQYSQQINQQLPLVRDASTNQYINALGRRLAQVADSRGIPYTFYVVNSDVVNAFSIPGGYVYVNRGLIERADNEAQLAGVLSHEIAHVVERHSVNQMARAQNANTLLSVLYGVLLRRNPSGVEQAGIQVGGSAVFAGYSRTAEREADHDAVITMVRAGYAANQLPAFFEKLMAQERSQPSKVEQWFATHPGSQERIANAQAEIAATPGATNPRLTTDTRAFQNFRARVRSLTPVPQDRG
jgi:predicted Zn-dependent protease